MVNPKKNVQSFAEGSTSDKHLQADAPNIKITFSEYVVESQSVQIPYWDVIFFFIKTILPLRDHFVARETKINTDLRRIL